MSKLSSSGGLWMGEGTLRIPMELFALNRRRLVEKLAPKNLGNAIVILKGGNDFPLYDGGMNLVFQQEPFFVWSFGVREPGCYGAVEVQSGKSILFVPHLDESYAVWNGPLWSTEDFKNKYQVDEVYYTEDIVKILQSRQPSVLLTLTGKNYESGLPALEADFEGIENFNLNKEVLFPDMTELRVVKTEYELEVMRYVIQVSCDAHCQVMRVARPGRAEYHCETEFLHYCYTVGGCRHAAYTSVCGSGPNSSILHYGHAGAPNDRFMEDGDMCVYDMGGRYFGYSADITCSFPVNGKFTPDQTLIYEAVLKANRAVLRELRPGVLIRDMNNLALRVILTDLKEGGLVKGNVDDMMEAGLGSCFQPHGLSHLLGIDVHDVGGFPQVKSASTPVDKATERMSRPLIKGMVLTIEPGCYFIDPLLDKAMADPKLSVFLVPEVIARFRGSGGVRIEDNVYITDTGMEQLSFVPRTVKEIESWMASGNKKA